MPGQTHTKAPVVLRLPPNHAGRDFVVGDIHGAYDMVIDAMKLVNFDRETDRLLSVGDLIDRGPESARCAKFLQQHYVYAVSGNHEKNLLDIYKDGPPAPEVLDVFVRMFHMEWVRTVEPAQMETILALFCKLPVAMEIPTERGLVGLVHGEVPIGMNWADFTQKLAQGDLNVMESALEGRKRINSNNQSGVQGIDRLFVGHTPQRGGAKRFGNVYAVDTGAIFNQLKGKDYYGMTMANLTCKTGSLVRPGTGAVNAVMAFDEGTNEVFGDYAERP